MAGRSRWDQILVWKRLREVIRERPSCPGGGLHLDIDTVREFASRHLTSEGRDSCRGRGEGGGEEQKNLKRAP
jgi:hypothetical protein